MTNKSSDTPRWKAIPFMTIDTPRTDAWECFSDPSYYDMARLRRTDGPKDFNTGYHLNNLREAIEVRDTLNELDRRVEKAEAEVERLQSQLNRSIEIADELSSGDAWKFTAADEKLVVLKGEIN